MEKEMMLQMIKRVKEYAENHLKDGQKYNDQLAFQAGFYESTIKTIVDMIDFIEKRDNQELNRMLEEMEMGGRK